MNESRVSITERTMTGLWLEDQRVRLRHDLPVPLPPDGEALVRVVRAGVCNTDLELARGYYPYAGVLGHEFVGIVEEGPRDLLGCRVVGEINAVCHECPTCIAGRKAHCERRTVLGIVGRHGAFAEYLTLPVENLHLVPDSLSTDAATFTEPVAAALQIPQQVHIRPADRVLVVGDGKLGQLIAQVLARTGCDLTVIGHHTNKLQSLARHGIRVAQEQTLAPSGPELSGTGPSAKVQYAGFDLVVECTGNASGFATALGALRPCGTLVLKSTYAEHLTFSASRIVVDEIRVVGSRCGPFEPALRWLANGRIEVDSLIAARYPLAAAEQAFEHAGRRGSLKVLLDLEEFAPKA